ncbi:protocadherin Fat 3-like isoform X1 [Pomacea canaliculata]|uniref:protocadherin Fat 3-like isoform X1 n=2 Tax=Pomacea canaliculata TaxID=400727 RepID=UPI000D729A0F|nr:protocadherin Fat 3-like isoform X1 [Pomacea canaliculata]
MDFLLLTHRIHNSSLWTRICVVGTLVYKASPYNLTLEVFEKGLTSVRLSIDIVDENQAPSFLSKEYVFMVAEDTPAMTVLATVEVIEGPEVDSQTADTDTILVWDQDTFTDAFRFKQLVVTDFMVRMPGSSLFDKRNISWSPVQLSVLNRTFYLSTTPTPDVQYRLTLKAEDRSGLFDTANITFYINDTNQAPTCHNYSVTMDLVTPVGTEVVTVSCADNDTTPEFSELVYRGNIGGNNDYFSMNSTGTISLARALPVGVVNTTYSVHAQDGGGLSGTAVVNIRINSNYPPRCNISQAIATFRETDPAGTCSQQVTCQDSANRSLPLNVSVAGGLGQRPMVVNTTQLATDGLALSLCIMQDGSNAVENFSVQVDVSSLLGVVSVKWNVSIRDVNQAPYFRRSAYRLAVMENVAVGESLAVVRVATNISDTGSDADIVAYDPDLLTDDFKIQNISLDLKVEYLNGTHLENLSPAPLRLVNSSLRVVAPLRADFVYQLTFTAQDGEGLTGNVTLTITINDTNQPPECHPDSVLTVDLKTSVSTKVYTIQCSDPDVDPKFHSLTFGLHTELNYTFFNVTAATGDVMLVKPVPRTARDLHVKVFASDGGGLTANTTLNFTVSGNYSPVCSPVYVPPDTEWTHGRCFRVEPHCSDPSTPDGDLSFLKYNFSGNFLNAFTVNKSLENGTYAEFCYTMYTNGSFQMDLRVDNGLGTYLWNYVVTVMYLRAAPRFTETVYTGFVNESAAVGLIVLMVRATVNGTKGGVVYTLLDDGGDFGLFFKVDNQTGDIRVLADLVTRVATTLSGHITAEDQTTGLNTTAVIHVKVEDVNQPPVCNSSRVSSVVPWNVAPQQVIARVACWDPDPTPSFSNITYLIVGDGVWDINSTSGDVFVKARSLLLPEKSTFAFNVTVTDGAYNITVLLNIVVNRTAPSPNVTVTRVDPTSASVAWTFDPVYEGVIQMLIVETAHVNGTHVQRAARPPSARDYVVEQLTPLQTYIIVVVVVGMDTNSSSNSRQFTTQQAIIADSKLTFTEGLIIENDNVTLTCTARTPGSTAPSSGGHVRG